MLAAITNQGKPPVRAESEALVSLPVPGDPIGRSCSMMEVIDDHWCDGTVVAVRANCKTAGAGDVGSPVDWTVGVRLRAASLESSVMEVGLCSVHHMSISINKDVGSSSE